MKAVILAGGYGSRLSEETVKIPKPMVRIGGFPIIWHIMKIYYEYGVKDFVILGGYKINNIIDYFRNYWTSNNSVKISNDRMDIINSFQNEKWNITILNTGEDSMTGNRIYQARDILKEESFFLTYGDGVGNINLNELLTFHKKNNSTVTLTAAKPAARFGILDIDESDKIISFKEKPQGDNNWINAGFFVCNNKIFDYLSEDKNCILERDPLENLANDNNLYAYKHNGFWMPMDTMRDKNILNDFWKKNDAKWKVWN